MGWARVLRRSDEYMRGRTCRRGKAVDSKKLPPYHFANALFVGTLCTDGLSTELRSGMSLRHHCRRSPQAPTSGYCLATRWVGRGQHAAEKRRRETWDGNRGICEIR